MSGSSPSVLALNSLIHLIRTGGSWLYTQLKNEILSIQCLILSSVLMPVDVADALRDFGLTGNQHAKEVVLDAAESLVDRYSEGVRRSPIERSSTLTLPLRPGVSVAGTR